MARAVPAFKMSSNFTGCSIGRSLGLRGYEFSIDSGARGFRGVEGKELGVDAGASGGTWRDSARCGALIPRSTVELKSALGASARRSFSHYVGRRRLSNKIAPRWPARIAGRECSYLDCVRGYMTDRLVPSQFATIQAAIEAAVAADRIVLEAGVDDENAEVTKNLAFLGQATNTGIVLTLADGIAVTLDGTAPFRIVDSVAAESASGNEGDNVFTLGPGADTVAGAGGTDTLDLSAATAPVIVDLGASTAASDGFGSADTISGIENVIGGSAADRLTGSTVANYLGGGAGADTALGGDGHDQMDGGAGNDALFGEADSDVLLGGGGNDYLVGGGGNDKAFGEAGNDTVIGAEADDYLNGGVDDDLIIGNAGADTLLGDSGNDYLDGGDGADLLFGGSGTDTVLGAGGDDYVNGGAGDDLVFGGDGVDTLLGEDGNDYLNGENGNDIIFAGSGSDYLKGDAGDDRFIFDATFQTSLVIDFTPGAGPVGHDVIQFATATFANFADAMAHAVQDGTNTVFTDAGGHTLTLANVKSRWKTP